MRSRLTLSDLFPEEAFYLACGFVSHILGHIFCGIFYVLTLHDVICLFFYRFNSFVCEIFFEIFTEIFEISHIRFLLKVF